MEARKIYMKRKRTKRRNFCRAGKFQLKRISRDMREFLQRKQNEFLSIYDTVASLTAPSPLFLKSMCLTDSKDQVALVHGPTTNG